MKIRHALSKIKPRCVPTAAQARWMSTGASSSTAPATAPISIDELSPESVMPESSTEILSNALSDIEFRAFRGEAVMCERIFHSMKVHQPLRQHFVAVASAHALRGDRQKVDHWMKRMISAGHDSTPACYAQLVRAASRISQNDFVVDECLHWLTLMERSIVTCVQNENLPPQDVDVVLEAYCSTLKALGRRQTPRDRRASDAEITTDLMLRLQQASTTMHNNKVKPLPQAALRAAIMIFGRRGNVKEAERHLDALVAQGGRLDVTVLANLLAACARSSPPDTARAEVWFSKMIGSLGIVPDTHCLNSLVDAFCKAGDSSSAQKWLGICADAWQKAAQTAPGVDLSKCQVEGNGRSVSAVNMAMGNFNSTGALVFDVGADEEASTSNLEPEVQEVYDPVKCMMPSSTAQITEGVTSLCIQFMPRTITAIEAIREWRQKAGLAQEDINFFFMPADPKAESENYEYAYWYCFVNLATEEAARKFKNAIHGTRLQCAQPPEYIMNQGRAAAAAWTWKPLQVDPAGDGQGLAATMRVVVKAFANPATGRARRHGAASKLPWGGDAARTLLDPRGGVQAFSLDEATKEISPWEPGQEAISLAAAQDFVKEIEQQPVHLAPGLPRPDKFSFQLLLALFAREGRSEKCGKWIARMRQGYKEGAWLCAPSWECYKEWLDAIRIRYPPDAELAACVIAEMKLWKVRVGYACFHRALHTCAKAGQPKMAIEIFESMMAEGDRLKPVVQRDVVTYNHVISAFAKAGDVQNAQVWFDKLQENGLRPTVETFAAIMSAYSEVGDGASAVRYLKQSLELGFTISNSALVANVLNLVAQQGQSQILSNVLKFMEATNSKVDPFVYNSILAAYAVRGHKLSAEKFFKTVMLPAQARLGEMNSKERIVVVESYEHLAAACRAADPPDFQSARFWTNEMQNKSLSRLQLPMKPSSNSNSTSSANLNPTNSSNGMSNSSRANESTPDATSANQDRKTSNEQSPRRNDRDRIQIKKRNVSLTMQHEAGLAWGQSNPGAAGGRFAVCAMPTDLD